MDKPARRFKDEKLGYGVYRVTPKEDLTEGKYRFYNGGGPSAGARMFVFGSICQIYHGEKQNRLTMLRHQVVNYVADPVGE